MNLGFAVFASTLVGFTAVSVAYAVGFATGKEAPLRLGVGLAVLGLVAHGVALITGWNTDAEHLWQTTAALEGTMVLAALVATGMSNRTRPMGAFIAPVGLAIALLTLWGPGGAAMASRLSEDSVGPLLLLHVGATFLSFLFLTLSFGAAVLYLVMARRLKTKRRALLLGGPSLERIDRTLYISMLIGVALLTVGIGVGAVWAGTRGSPGFIGPKVVSTVLAWLLFAVVAQFRWVFGWRGQRGAGLVVGSYIWLLVAMLVVRHVT